ncbi:hypothetical protein PV05_03922 [Exophiala xenobiotica]|uniref:Uncharacterized protein n=1 Tax=Exophiala xenobiotica TaxID=348802 RepID=A0A0D2EXM5_9EURO|nr:uncharacterized protein PV05_03922 [Exophiala xenobiotica]KIW59475.1 hypothetical protein PV05_03922 [Exophiala xenobiotica]
MASETEVYIAGVGFPTLSLAGTSVKTIVASLVSAATKALLDASVTFDDVTQTVVTLSGNTPNYGSEVSGAFCHRDIAMDEVEKGYEFDTSFTLIRDRSAQCGMLNTVKKSHTYLKDSAVLVRKPHTRRVDAKGRTVDRLYDICQIGTWIKGPGVISAKMESSLGAQRMVAAPRHG